MTDNTLIKMNLFGWDCIRVTPSTLFKKKEYQGLNDTERWQKAVNDGWRFDMQNDKFYRLVNNN